MQEITETTQQQTINVAGATPEITSERGEELNLTLGEFAGHMDLLLYLIRQEQVNIYDIPIARITNEYLRYLKLMRELDITMAGEFLVMAATLIEIKSKMLLPRDPLAPIDEDEDDPRRELIDRLLEHQKFKSAAQMLWSRSTVEQAVYTRAAIETDKNNPEISVGVFDLLSTFQKILARKKDEILLEIEREEMTMAEMIERLRALVAGEKKVNLRVFFEQAQSKKELVIAFLSVLELVRLAEIVFTQKNTFGDIFAKRRLEKKKTERPQETEQSPS